MEFVLEDTYRAYFLHQAENHPELLHSNDLGERVFEVITTEEALGDFRTGAQAKGYILRLLEYTYQVTDGGAHEVRKQVQGGFIVAHYHSNRSIGSSDYLEARRKAEKVADEIIEKMIADSKNGHPLFYYSLDSRQDFNVSPVRYVGDGGYSGWLVLFSFENYWRNCVDNEDAPEWVDGGITPHEL